MAILWSTRVNSAHMASWTKSMLVKSDLSRSLASDEDCMDLHSSALETAPKSISILSPYHALYLIGILAFLGIFFGNLLPFGEKALLRTTCSL